jgi:EAL domain-containing protein (putative c-di-GMP-specific phosphodiesterase class I)
MLAAGAAVWNWRPAADALSIRAEPGGPIASLDGCWTLSQFLDQIEGLSRAGLGQSLRSVPEEGLIDVRVLLANGQAAHVIGSYIDAAHARGLIVAGAMTPRASEAQGNIVPVFQPIRHLDTLEVAGFEALVRFRTPEGRLVSPDGLPGGANEIDWSLIAPTMLSHAVRALANLRAAGRNVFMQVNLSAIEIAQPDLVESLADLIREAKLPPGAFRIELTEQAALRDFDGALGALAAFRASGAGIVLDDFGAGHSSFAWLAEVPADGVKLDPKLVRMAREPRAAMILAGLARLIRDLGMTVTAEGIEDPDLAPALAAMGCDFVQGFAFDMPIREEDLDAAFDPLPART